MDMIFDIASTVIAQLQKPTLAFLLGGMMLAALGSKLEVPEPVYKFVVMLLLLKVGLGAGISIREADLVALAVPAVCAILAGVGIVLLGSNTLARWKGVSKMDGYATAGLFGAVSASTLAAAMAMLDAEEIFYEGFIGALYPFMDVAALVTAILLAKLSAARAAETAQATLPQNGIAAMTMDGLASGLPKQPRASDKKPVPHGLVGTILTDTVQSAAISALLLGIAIGVLGRPESVYASFYEPLFRGLLSILMLVMGMDGLGAAVGTAQGGACLCPLRADGAADPWPDRVWLGHDRSPDYRVLGGWCGAACGHGRVQLRHLRPAHDARRAAGGERLRLRRRVDRSGHACGDPEHSPVDLAR